FSPQDRAENLRRAGAVAAMFADAALVVIASFISPYRRERAAARTVAAPTPFVEAFVDCPLEECVRRDPKGLYARAHAGQLAELTGGLRPLRGAREPGDPSAHRP